LMATRAGSFSAFVGEQIRQTKQRPARLVLIPLHILANVAKPIRRLHNSDPGRGTSTVPPLPTNPRNEAQSGPDSHSSFGELQSNNCYLNRNPPPDLLALAQHHAERRLDNFIFDPALLARQNALLSKRLWNFFQGTTTFQHVKFDEICDCIAKYREIYLAAPMT